MSRALALAALACALGCRGGSPAKTVTPECTTRSDCSGGLDGGLICVSGACEGCTSSSQCRLIEACDPVQERCTLLPCFGDACALDTDCPLGQYCVQGLCLSPGPANAQGCAVILCGSDRDCNAGQLCSPQDFVCVTDLGCDPVLAPCAIGQVCNTATGVCVPGCTAATSAQVCGPLVSCIDGRCVQCAQDSDCGPGLSCDLSSGECAAQDQCTSSRDCPTSESCDGPTGTCVSTPRPPCTSNESCASDERCQTRTGQCVSGACALDRYSPNTTQATAAPLSAGAYPQLTLCSATQESWFSFALLSGDVIQVVSDADPLGSFDMQLLAPDGTLLDEEQLSVEGTAGSDGTYFVRIRTNDASVLYGLQIIIRPGTACAENPAGDHDQASAAVALGPGEYGGYSICPGEPTWFVLRGNPDAGAPGIEADAALDPTQGGPLLMTLFDSDARTVLAQDASGSGALHVQAAAAASGGNFFLEIAGASGTVANTYDLTVRSFSP